MKYLIKPTRFIIGLTMIAVNVGILWPLMFLLTFIWHLNIVTALEAANRECEYVYEYEVLGMTIYRYKTLSDFTNGIKSDKHPHFFKD